MVSALLTDVAEDAGVPFARLGAGTLQGLRTVLSPALVPDNPLDAWDALEGAEQVFTGSLLALHDDPPVAVVGLCVDLTDEESSDIGYVKVSGQVHAATTKPFLVLSHASDALGAREAARLREAGVDVLVSCGLTRAWSASPRAADRGYPHLRLVASGDHADVT